MIIWNDLGCTKDLNLCNTTDARVTDSVLHILWTVELKMERFCEFLMMKLKRVPACATFHNRRRINSLSVVNKLDAYAIVGSRPATVNASWLSEIQLVFHSVLSVPQSIKQTFKILSSRWYFWFTVESRYLEVVGTIFYK